MSDLPFFSVIIPTHNGAYRINTAIESCLEQSFRDFEAIVICDSCTDDTADVVKQYTARDERVTMHTTDVHRDGLARNVGLLFARGQYILFLDDDDWWLHEFVFQQMHDMLKDSYADVLNFGVVWRHVGVRADPPGVFIPMVAGHCWLRTFIGDSRFDDAEFSSDTHFLGEMIRKKPVGLWSAMPMYYYNFDRPGSLNDRHKKGEI